MRSLMTFPLQRKLVPRIRRGTRWLFPLQPRTEKPADVVGVAIPNTPFNELSSMGCLIATNILWSRNVFKQSRRFKRWERGWRTKTTSGSIEVERGVYILASCEEQKTFKQLLLCDQTEDAYGDKLHVPKWQTAIQYSRQWAEWSKRVRCKAAWVVQVWAIRTFCKGLQAANSKKGGELIVETGCTAHMTRETTVFFTFESHVKRHHVKAWGQGISWETDPQNTLKGYALQKNAF